MKVLNAACLTLLATAASVSAQDTSAIVTACEACQKDATKCEIVTTSVEKDLNNAACTKTCTDDALALLPSCILTPDGCVTGDASFDPETQKFVSLGGATTVSDPATIKAVVPGVDQIVPTIGTVRDCQTIAQLLSLLTVDGTDIKGTVSGVFAFDEAEGENSSFKCAFLAGDDGVTASDIKATAKGQTAPVVCESADIDGSTVGPTEAGTGSTTSSATAIETVLVAGAVLVAAGI